MLDSLGESRFSMLQYSYQWLCEACSGKEMVPELGEGGAEGPSLLSVLFELVV